MLTKEEIKKWLLENCVDKDGDLVIRELDFSDFNGDIYIQNWKVAKDLVQEGHIVGKDLYQHSQNVCGNLVQDYQIVLGTLSQGNQRVGKNLLQGYQTVFGKIISSKNFVGAAKTHKEKFEKFKIMVNLATKSGLLEKVEDKEE